MQCSASIRVHGIFMGEIHTISSQFHDLIFIFNHYTDEKQIFFADTKNDISNQVQEIAGQPPCGGNNASVF